jgi:hypothetical protein
MSLRSVSEASISVATVGPVPLGAATMLIQETRIYDAAVTMHRRSPNPAGTMA